MKKIITAIALAQSMWLSGAVYAVPHSFSAGESASAQHVNENFESLENRHTTYDYHDYGMENNISKKIFSTDSQACGQTEVRNYSFTQNGDDTHVAVQRVRHAGDELSEVCQNRTFNYINGQTERKLVSKENWNAAGTILRSTDTPETPMVHRHSSMIKGQVFGTASAISRTIDGLTEAAGAILQTNVVLGVEDVVVPFGSYSACLKIHTKRNSSQFSNFNRVSWICNGVGEVKRINVFFDGTSKTWLLQNMLTN